MNRQFLSLILLFLSWITIPTAFGQKLIASEKELKEKATDSFKAEDYSSAAASYSQLLSLHPSNADFNYGYGVSILLSGKEKEKAAVYLEVASKGPKINADVFFYLGRAYTYAGKYDEAIHSFETFTGMVGASKAAKYETEKYLAGCKVASELQKSRKDVSIISTQQLKLYGFYSVYDYSQIDGKILSTPVQFLSSTDRDKMNDPAMNLTPDDKIFFASYGKNSKDGKDLYCVQKAADGSWGKPENLGYPVNSAGNEDFPFFDTKTHTLYFSSKGPNSIGGYDIFKSTRDPVTGQWSTPVNMGLPINTPDDDILYVPSSSGPYATYATNVNSEKARIEVRRIQVSQATMPMATIRGRMVTEDQAVRKDAKISVQEPGKGIAAQVRTNELTGEYEFMLVPGKSYVLVVEAGGYATHREDFEVPAESRQGVWKQEVRLDRKGGEEDMQLKNYFVPGPVEAPLLASESKMQSQSGMPADVRKENEKPVKAGSSPGEMPAVAATQSNETNSVPVGTQASSKDAGMTAGPTTQTTSLGNSVNTTIANKTSQDNSSQGKPSIHSAATETIDPSTSAVAISNGNNTLPVVSPESATPGAANTGHLPANSIAENKTVISKNSVASDPGTLAISQQAAQREASAQVAQQQSLQYDSLSKEQLKIARATLLEGDPAKADMAKAVFRESLKNKKIADSSRIEASRLKQEAVALRKQESQMTGQATQASLLSGTNGTQNSNVHPEEASVMESSKQAQEPVGATTENKVNSNVALTVPKSSVAKPSPLTNNAETIADAAKPEDAASIENKTTGDLTTSVPVTGPANDQKTNAVQPASITVTSTDGNTTTTEQASPAMSNENASASLTVPKKGLPAVKQAEMSMPENAQAETAMTSSQPSKIAGQEQGLADETTSVVAGTNDPSTTGSNDLSPGEEMATTVTMTEGDARTTVAEAGSSTESATAVMTEAEISQSFEQLQPETRQAMESYRSNMKESIQMDDEAGQIVEKTVTMKPGPERDKQLVKANDMFHASIVKWQQAQAELDKAKAQDTTLQDKLPSGVFAFGPETQTSVKTPIVQKENWDTTSVTYSEYRTVNAKISEGKTATIMTFADALSVGQQAEQKYEQEAALRAQASAETDSVKKMLLVKEAFQLKQEADSLQLAANNRMNEARMRRAEVNSQARQSQALEQQLADPVLHAKASPQPETAGFVIPVKGSSNRYAQPTASAGVNTTASTVTTASSEITSAEPLVESPLAMQNREQEKITRQEKVAQSEIKETNASMPVTSVTKVSYSRNTTATSTVPMNPEMPEGLIFKVQVGAFRTPIPASSFKGIEPVSGETSRAGWIRYCVGIFSAMESAQAVKSEMRNIGFRDAFVVAYYNGKRIGMHEATAMMNRATENDKANYAAACKEERMQLLAMNIHVPVQAETAMTEVTPSTRNANGILEYAVQVGVYRNERTPAALMPLGNLYTEKVTDRKFRFTTAHTESLDKAEADKKAAQASGVKDAFIVVYKDGQRLSSSEAMAARRMARGEKRSMPAIQPVALASKPEENPVQYKVQLGAFRESVPLEVVKTFVNISSAGITQETDSGLMTFFAGCFSKYDDALKLKNEISSKGIRDAFVVPFQNGKKLQTQEAVQEFR